MRKEPVRTDDHILQEEAARGDGEMFLRVDASMLGGLCLLAQSCDLGPRQCGRCRHCRPWWHADEQRVDH